MTDHAALVERLKAQVADVARIVRIKAEACGSLAALKGETPDADNWRGLYEELADTAWMLEELAAGRDVAALHDAIAALAAAPVPPATPIELLRDDASSVSASERCNRVAPSGGDSGQPTCAFGCPNCAYGCKCSVHHFIDVVWPERGECTCDWIRYEEMHQRDPNCPRHKDAPDPPKKVAVPPATEGETAVPILKEVVISEPGASIRMAKTEVPAYIQRAIVDSVERGKRDALGGDVSAPHAGYCQYPNGPCTC